MDEYLEQLDKKRTLRESDLANWEALRQVVPLAGDYYTMNSASDSGALNLVELSALRTVTTETLQVINFWQHPPPQIEPPSQSQFGTSSSIGHPTRPLSQIARTTVITSMLVDRIFRMDPYYSRNVAHPFPIIFKVNSEESFYLPQLDFSLEANGEYCRLLVEEKRAVDNRENGSVRAKLAFMSCANLIAASVGQTEELAKRLVSPSLYFNQTAFYLYFTAWEEDLSKFKFTLVHLRFDVVETPGRQAVMQKFQQRRAKCWLSAPKRRRGRKRAARESMDEKFSDEDESDMEDSETFAEDSRALGYDIHRHLEASFA
ncbi:hypothetical protein HDU76_001356 [Blyttiomyces sp. JEL0837]|nr:hypothetical protein HDU76_001356 [Blyttiomyces sp. JEL0837]